MKTRGMLTICLAFSLVGCSRNYEVDIQIRPNEVAGDWSISAAPQAVKQKLTNDLAKVQLVLNADGTAHFYFLPFEELAHSGHIPTSKWSVVSGQGKWELSDWGQSGRHVWRVGLETSARGLQLIVGRAQSNEIVLVYTPDPDNEKDSVVFRRIPLKSSN